MEMIVSGIMLGLYWWAVKQHTELKRIKALAKEYGVKTTIDWLNVLVTAIKYAFYGMITVQLIELIAGLIKLWLSHV